jgi:hypothetical protein
VKREEKERAAAHANGSKSTKHYLPSQTILEEDCITNDDGHTKATLLPNNINNTFSSNTLLDTSRNKSSMAFGG